MMYVNKNTLKITSHNEVQRATKLYKLGDFTSEEIDPLGYAILVEPAQKGDHPTGKAVFIDGQYVREYTSSTTEEKISQAKQVRFEGRRQPISVQLQGQPKTFDVNEESFKDLMVTLQFFEAIRQRFITMYGHPDDGTIPWRQSNGQIVSITLSELQAIGEAIAVRGVDLQVEYQLSEQAAQL